MRCEAAGHEARVHTAPTRDMLEELMDDEDEVREMNLSSRPEREERRRLRERERLERGAERCAPCITRIRHQPMPHSRSHHACGAGPAAAGPQPSQGTLVQLP